MSFDRLGECKLGKMVKKTRFETVATCRENKEEALVKINQAAAKSRDDAATAASY